MSEAEPSGVLVVDKPAGPTSHDVVDRVRRLYGLRKVGHAGTLDPPATGILLLGLGRATRVLPFLASLPKTYAGWIRFGITTSTQDATGEEAEVRTPRFTRDELEAAAGAFRGAIEQVPPMVSSVKIAGEPLYRAARRGEEVERPARVVHVYEMELGDFDPGAWTASLRVRCSSGTYVRTLAADLGERLGCGGHLTALRRTAVGSFDEGQASTLDDLEAADEAGRLASILPPAEAMRDFPFLTASPEEAEAVAHGLPLAPRAPARAGELPLTALPRIGGVEPHEAGMTAGVPVAIIGEDGSLLAVYRRSRNRLRPAVVFASR